MIAHRLSTLDICNLHLELAHGRLVSIHDSRQRLTAGSSGVLGHGHSHG
jgi:hypothetical protein